MRYSGLDQKLRSDDEKCTLLSGINKQRLSNAMKL